MAELKSMPWSDKVWQALKAAITPMPPFVRGNALRKVVAASEDNARARHSELVEAKDLVKAAQETVPRVMQKMCLQALAEHGVTDDS